MCLSDKAFGSGGRGDGRPNNRGGNSGKKPCLTAPTGDRPWRPDPPVLNPLFVSSPAGNVSTCISSNPKLSPFSKLSSESCIRNLDGALVCLPLTKIFHPGHFFCTSTAGICAVSHVICLMETFCHWFFSPQGL